MFSLTENYFKNEDKKRQKEDQKKLKKNNNNVNPKWKKNFACTFVASLSSASDRPI